MSIFEKIDKVLLITVLIMLGFGLLIFGSAALGVLSSNEVKFYNVIETQLIFALFGGMVALFLGMRIPFYFYNKYAPYIFAVGLFVTSLVFVPFLATYHGGAHRWIHIGSFSIQTSEFLKFAFVIMTASWCAKYGGYFKDIRFGFLPYFFMIVLVASVMLLQPDFGTFLIMLAASFAVYFIGGAKWKHVVLLTVVGVLGVTLLVFSRPYMMERIHTFLNASHDIRGSSWQVNQSLIAIGSGGFLGRGYGQSVQKFNYLPEPIGDSIFAVLGEELGVIGVGFLVMLYGIVIVRGLRIALYSESQFGRLVVVGIVATITAQTMLNIGSMVGIFPLTGVPLPFISHGGTALMAILFQVGVILNISRQSHFV